MEKKKQTFAQAKPVTQTVILTKSDNQNDAYYLSIKMQKQYK